MEPGPNNAITDVAGVRVGVGRDPVPAHRPRPPSLRDARARAL